MNIFIGLAAIHLIVSGSIVLLSCGYILFDTSQIINGGQRNYIMATLALYINIFNLFINLLHLLAAFAGRRD
jgi:modulator of FtsH protease